MALREKNIIASAFFSLFDLSVTPIQNLFYAIFFTLLNIFLYILLNGHQNNAVGDGNSAKYDLERISLI